MIVYYVIIGTKQCVFDLAYAHTKFRCGGVGPRVPWTLLLCNDPELLPNGKGDPIRCTSFANNGQSDEEVLSVTLQANILSMVP